jgi:hypothetical protein
VSGTAGEDPQPVAWSAVSPAHEAVRERAVRVARRQRSVARGFERDGRRDRHVDLRHLGLGDQPLPLPQPHDSVALDAKRPAERRRSAQRHLGFSFATDQLRDAAAHIAAVAGFLRPAETRIDGHRLGHRAILGLGRSETVW